jgi:AcrR family transcriptional regulator
VNTLKILRRFSKQPRFANITSMSRRPDPALAERRRLQLVRAGYAEILEKGIQGITLDSVVARAGSSKGGALHYFHTKDDLLLGVLQWLLGQVDRTLEDVAHTDASPRSRLASELEVLFHSAEVNRKLYLVLFDYVSVATRADRFRSLLVAFFEACRRRDTAIVEEGIRQQQFRRVNPADAAVTIRALVDGYCLQWLLAADSTPVEVYRDRCRAVLGSYLLR